MTETILDSLVVKIRADSADLRGQLADIEKDFGGLEAVAGKTTDAMTRVFENFARSGELSFSNLKSAALSVLNDIANSAIQSGLNSLFGSGNGMGSILGDLAGSFLFGRAGGGTVGSRQPYLVGERGPELFVPEGSGRIIAQPGSNSTAASSGRTSSNITINITNQGGAHDMTERSSTQVAVAVRRAMDRAERDL
ncbi:MAG: tail tape measure protein [Alphaproteobacteria bacterium]|nr:MAG: tail tape measure protein [Alphaproteobacteria bacterium]